MTWTAFHHRSDVTRRVVDELDRRRDGRLPWHLTGVAETFVDRRDLLGALAMRWSTRLGARLEAELAVDPADRDAAVRRAWTATARDLPGIRAVLDHQHSAPEDDRTATMLGRVADHEHALLAHAAGRASSPTARDALTLEAGRALEEGARASYRPLVPMPAPMPERGVVERERVPSGSAAFVARVKAALSAA